MVRPPLADEGAGQDVISLQYLWDLADYREEIGLYAPAARLRLQFPSPFYKNMPTPVVLSGMEGEAAWEKRVIASYQEAFKEELRHFAECVTTGRPPLTGVDDAAADVAWLHRIWAARSPRSREGVAGRGTTPELIPGPASALDRLLRLWLYLCPE